LPRLGTVNAAGTSPAPASTTGGAPGVTAGLGGRAITLTGDAEALGPPSRKHLSPGSTADPPGLVASGITCFSFQLPVGQPIGGTWPHCDVILFVVI